MEPEVFMTGLFPEEGKELKSFIKGEADVFSLVLEYIEKKATSLKNEGLTALLCSDIINEINNYINDIVKDTSILPDSINGSINAAKWFERYFKDEKEIELNELRFVYNAIEERFQILWINCLD